MHMHTDTHAYNNSTARSISGMWWNNWDWRDRNIYNKHTPKKKSNAKEKQRTKNYCLKSWKLWNKSAHKLHSTQGEMRFIECSTLNKWKCEFFYPIFIFRVWYWLSFLRWQNVILISSCVKFEEEKTVWICFNCRLINEFFFHLFNGNFYSSAQTHKNGKIGMKYKKFQK